MKRYNIHLDPEWIKALEDVRQRIREERGITSWIRDLTRSDLIRFAIGQYFNLGEGYIHYFGDDLGKLIKKVLKKRDGDKSV